MPLPSRTRGDALVRALTQQSTSDLWMELRRNLPLELAARVFDATVAASLRS